MDWSKQQSENEIIAFINQSPNCVKVLAAENMKYENQEVRCEGVFVYRLDGNKDNGVGILLSNIFSIDFPFGRGDVVQYREVNKEQKSFITSGVSGKNN